MLRTVMASALLLGLPGARAAPAIPAPPAATYVCRFSSLTYLPGTNMLGVTSAPSALGNLRLDGRGGYTLVKDGRRGTYSVNPASGVFTFRTGPLAVFAGRYEYTDDGFKTFYAVVLKEKPGQKSIGNQACRLEGKSRGQNVTNVPRSSAGSGAAGTRPANAPPSTAARPNPGLEGTVWFGSPLRSLDVASGRVTGRFDGQDASALPGGEVLYVTGGAVHLGRRDGTSARLFAPDPGEGEIGRPVMSRDGGRVAYVARRSYSQIDVRVRSRDGRLLATFEGRDSPSWTPDGRLVMAALSGLQGVQEGLFLTTPDLGTVRPIPLATSSASQPSVSPDGRQVAFVSNGHIWTANLDGSGLKQRTVTDKREEAPAWAPDSRTLLFLEAEYDVLQTVGPNGTQPRSLLDSGGKNLQSVGRVSWR